jgi:hypothetical protein
MYITTEETKKRDKVRKDMESRVGEGWENKE